VAEFASLKATRLELEMPAEESKLAACGMLVINPPWKFDEAMRESLPWIAAQLGPDVTARLSASPASAPVPASAS